jgi:hypothetical protein
VRRSTLLVVAVLGTAFILGALCLLRSMPAEVSGPNATGGIQHDSGSTSTQARGEDSEPARPPDSATSNVEDSARVAIDQAPPGARVLLAVDEQHQPILDARAVLLADRSEVRANAAGLIVFEQELGSGKVGLVGAEGRQPRFFELVGDKTTVILPADVGFPVQVLWKQTGEPAAGALVRRLSWITTVPGIRQPSTDEAFDKFFPRGFAVDDQGKTVVHGCNLEHFIGIEVTHPDGPTTLIDGIVIGSLELENGWRELTVNLDRDLPAYLIRCVDGIGKPIANRPTSILVGHERYERTTDSKGQVALWLEFPASVKLFSDSQPMLEIELGGGKSWFAFKCRPEPSLNYVVDHRPLAGVVQVEEGGHYSIASAALHGSFKTWPGYSAPEMDRLEWQSVAASEQQCVLKTGWQGERTGVVLRHDETGFIVDMVEVDAQGSFRLQSKPLCRLELRSASPEPVPNYSVEFMPGGNVGFLVNPSELPVVRDVPRGVYDVRWNLPGRPWMLASIDANSATATAVLALKPPRWVHGGLSGRLSGPMENVELLIQLEDGAPVPGVSTNSSGEFQAAIPNEGVLRFVPIGFRDDQLWPNEKRTFLLQPDQTDLRMVLPQALLVLDGNFSESLASRLGLRAKRIRTDGGFEPSAGHGLESTDRKMYLAPGEYQLEGTVGNAKYFETTVRLQDGETRTLQVPAVDQALLEIEIPNDSKVQGHFQLTVEAPDGKVLIDQMTGIPQPPDASQMIQFLTTAGAHRIKAGQLRGIGDSSDELLPLDWEEVVDCKVGERSFIRVPLK